MEASGFNTIGVVGGGAWGAALAQLCAGAGARTLLWMRDAEAAAEIEATREHAGRLPGVRLHRALQATSRIEDLAGTEALILAVPAQATRAMLPALRDGPHSGSAPPLLLTAKGVERGSGLFQTDIAHAEWPSAIPAVLSGPSFAVDVAAGSPTAVTLAAADQPTALRWRASLAGRTFRPYLSTDMRGAQLGGAVKNVLAIAAGAAVGRGLGESARAAIVARGFAEFQRLGLALGAEPETLSGLSGLGDLVLTATSRQSRNFSLGVALGEGRRLEALLAGSRSVNEGVHTADAVLTLAAGVGVETPICRAVAALIGGRSTLENLLEALLSRRLRAE